MTDTITVTVVKQWCAILEVPLSSSSDATAVKKAFREKSRRGPYRHPDKGGSKANFQALNEAYEGIQSDSAQRPLQIAQREKRDAEVEQRQQRQQQQQQQRQRQQRQQRQQPDFGGRYNDAGSEMDWEPSPSSNFSDQAWARNEANRQEAERLQRQAEEEERREEQARLHWEAIFEATDFPGKEQMLREKIVQLHRHLQQYPHNFGTRNTFAWYCRRFDELRNSEEARHYRAMQQEEAAAHDFECRRAAAGAAAEKQQQQEEDCCYNRSHNFEPCQDDVPTANDDGSFDHCHDGYDNDNYNNCNHSMSYDQLVTAICIMLVVAGLLTTMSAHPGYTLTCSGFAGLVYSAQKRLEN